MRVWAREIMKYIKVFLHFKRINFMERLAFRSGFAFLTFGVTLNIFLNLFFIKVIYSWVTDIKGWSYYEALIVVGTSILVEGVIWMTCAYLHALKVMLKTGELDGYLVKPMESQYLVTCYRGDLEDVVRLMLGLGIIIFGISHLPLTLLTLAVNLPLFIILLISSIILLYSISVIANSISFWTVESPSTFVIFETISRSAQFPSDIFSGKAKIFFSTVIPIAFIATVPADALINGFSFRLVFGSFGVSLFFFFLSRYVWKKGLGSYSSASS